MNILFFGSSTDSVIVLEKLFKSEYQLAGVVTQPPRPVGRKGIITPTPVEQWAKEHSITVLSFPSKADQPTLFENEQTVIDTLQPLKPDLLVAVSYGQRIPWVIIENTRYGGLNLHPSLLPRWRGADPVPWALLAGDHQTGITLVSLSQSFDEGKIFAQKKISISERVTREELRRQLFTLGAELLVETLPSYLSGELKGQPQDSKKAVYARRLTRQDGFISWELLQKAQQGKDILINEFSPFFQQFLKTSTDSRLLTTDHPQPIFLADRAVRALSPWPGVWTEVTERDKKRLKILQTHVEEHDNTSILVLDLIQQEGQKPIKAS